MRRKQVYLILCSVFTALSVVLGVTLFRASFARFWEALGDLFSSVVYYALNIFGGGEASPPSVTEYSGVLSVWFWMPQTWEQFRQLVKDYCTLLTNSYIFRSYLLLVSYYARQIGIYLMLLLPVAMIAWMLLKNQYLEPNNDYNQDTRQLRSWKQLMQRTFVPAKSFVLGFRDYLQEQDRWLKCWALLWTFSSNLASILAAFLAYYFYFAASMDFKHTFVQAFKLLVDLQFFFRYVPGPVWVIAGYVVLDVVRRHLAKKRLQRMEAMNCGFIKELPVVTMACGSMGKKKTTLITDMALSQEKMFRQSVFQILRGCDMKFPHFPWILFELELKRCIDHDTVWNLATVKAWVQKKEARFLKHRRSDLQLYGYDCQKYGLTFDDALGSVTLFEILETYAQAYFIYILRSSLIVSNYSIRSTEQVEDYGNLPLRKMDFFSDDELDSRYSHILDFDALRLGKKVAKQNPVIGSFEFGVVVISEIGKERGNQYDTKPLKKEAEEANLVNDLFNSWLKLSRHSATVDYKPFVRVFVDDQRPESWGADARELADLLHIVQSGDPQLAMPFYTIEDMVTEWVLKKFDAIYTTLRNRRGDNTLLIHLLKQMAAGLYRRNLRIHNRFGYSVLYIEKERGTKDGEVELRQYYLCDRKIYSYRFSTDCFSEYFNGLSRDAQLGLDDYPQYQDVKASVPELRRQNSYFIRSLYGEDTPGEDAEPGRAGSPARPHPPAGSPRRNGKNK